MKNIFTVSLLTFLFLLLDLRVQAAEHVDVIEIDGAINPVSARFIVESIADAENDGAQCLVLLLDTPGGLMESTWDIVQGILNARVPVVVYVYPRGARAGSAGVYITIAAHIAVMSEDTNIGAAHPVAISLPIPMPGASESKPQQTMMEKSVNDAVARIRAWAKSRGRNEEWVEKAVRESASITAREAEKAHVIDLICDDLDQLLEEIDGWTVKLKSGPVQLLTRGAEIHRKEMPLRYKILYVVSDPNIAYLLLLLGGLGIFFELSHPGVVLPGVVGAICLILAFFGLQILKINYAGLALIFVAIVLFILEMKVVSHGMLSVAGIISMIFGSLMLVDTPELRVSLYVIVPATLTVAAFFIFAVSMALNAQRRAPTTGLEGMIGEVGVAKSELSPEGKVFVHGEIWAARSGESEGERINAGEEVKVVAVERLKLEVVRS